MKNHNLYLSALVTLLFLSVSCGTSGSYDEQADNKSTEQVTAVVDSLMSLEPELALSSLSVVKAQMPSLISDEVKPAIEKTSENVVAYLFSQALIGKSSFEENDIMEDFVKIGEPLRESMRKYEEEKHPELIFGLASLTNVNDSTKTEKRVYIFDENDLSSVKRMEKFPSKSSKDILMLFALAYGDKIDYNNKDFKPEDIKDINENPILKFIVTDY